jgi:rare lipoprotein A (peptidoglycan hydrolase)
VNPLLAQRQIALAGIALLAGIVALGLSSTGSGPSGPVLPEAIPAPGGGWFSALASSHGPSFSSLHLDKTCGREVGPTSLGVAHPVLPCDSKVYIEYGDRKALTQVLARGPYAPGRDFELTPALARKLGLSGTQPVKWRFAR